MSDRSDPRCVLRRLGLSQLEPRPGRANRLLPRVKRALACHIGRTGLYPPLIVRPLQTGRFEILDGHQRAEILSELGSATARCEVWPIADAEADIAAATLNHLRGRPEAKAQARQISGLISDVGSCEAGRLMALSTSGIRQRLSVLKKPAPSPAETPSLDLRAVTFHLPRQQLQSLNRALRVMSGKSRSRGEALMALVEGAQVGRTLEE